MNSTNMNGGGSGGGSKLFNRSPAEIAGKGQKPKDVI